MYLLDANTYIQAKNFYYHMDFCPAYWDWLDQQYEVGIIGSIKSVYDELANNGDELSLWVESRANHFQPVSDQDTQQNMAIVSQYVANLRNKTPENISSFLGGADPWLIAKAIGTRFTIVTHELLVPENSKKIKIPNICQHFNIRYISTYDLLKNLNARFILQRTP